MVELIFKKKKRLPYGNRSRGTYIPPEKGRRAIFVPSFGTMDKDEIDYVTEVAQEQEDERIKRKSKSETKENLEQLVEATRSAPQGERAKRAREIIKEVGNGRE